tara:strand:+ start:2224 stop:4047 length:1824 start_codon:yes stop_codon:yes gene_type:complete
MAQTRNIKYINREFDDFRDQLVEFSKSYFPDTYNDFSPTSPGMMFMEMAAYVGDVLAFYQDTQLQETFLTHAKDPKNLFNLAYMMGYKPRVTGIAETEITITQVVDANGSYAPDFTQAAKINAQGSIISTDKSNTRFYIPKAVDFTFSSSFDPTVVTINDLDTSNRPTKFNLIKKVKAISGKIEQKAFTIETTPQKFKTITLSDNNIVQILKIEETNGYEYHEVPFLGQDTIFLDEANVDSDAHNVPYVLSLKKVPRRFVARFRADGNLDIQFGAGSIEQDDSVILPDASTIGNATNQGSLNYNGKGTVDKAYDPSNFTYSKAYGIAPDQGDQVFVTYLKGGGISANVPANSLSNATVSGTNINDLSFTNLIPATGGRDGDTIEELRENSLRAFNEQNRAVTLQDYTVRALSLPSQYGSIAKAYVIQDQLTNTNTTDAILDNNPLALSLYVLAYDNNSNLITATTTLKANLKTYLQNYMMLSDSINIKDAFVVNIGVKYEIITRPSYASRDVLLNCNRSLAEYFKASNRNINQPINLSEVFTLLDKVQGVQTVQKVEIGNKQGGNYSAYAYDVKGATRDNVVYPSYDPCIFEVKFPNTDIEGRVINI